MHILVIDDNEALSFGLKKLLIEAKFQVDTAFNLAEGQGFIDKKGYDLIILDWMLPDGSGVEFLKQNRDTNLLTSVLLLSSKSEDFEKAEALDCGADDYMQKPFSNIELLARIRAILRREGSQKQSILSVKNLQVDLSKREVLVSNESIKLSNKEFELLEFLLLNSNVVLTRYQISEHLNRDFDSLKTSNIVDAHIKNLRKKLQSASSVIETVRGVGFTIKKS
ncbi:MAG TPA: response regulator transcription factor [Campylobacterales bacterium]|nr:response regulator transcription factor [Campylobacterales bacterium]